MGYLVFPNVSSSIPWKITLKSFQLNVFDHDFRMDRGYSVISLFKSKFNNIKTDKDLKKQVRSQFNLLNPESLSIQVSSGEEDTWIFYATTNVMKPSDVINGLITAVSTFSYYYWDIVITQINDGIIDGEKFKKISERYPIKIEDKELNLPVDTKVTDLIETLINIIAELDSPGLNVSSELDKILNEPSKLLDEIVNKK